MQLLFATDYGHSFDRLDLQVNGFLVGLSFQSVRFDAVNIQSTIVVENLLVIVS